MATLEVRIKEFITSAATDWKNIWAKIGSGTLDTTATDLVAAVNEVKAAVDSATIPDASDTVKGKVELATTTEAVTGTDTVRAVTPAGVAAVFSDRIDTNTALGTSNTKVASQGAVKAYADALIAAANAMVFKGVIDASANPNYPAADAGDVYRISVAGKIGGSSGPNVEVGDEILCLTDSTSAGTHASVGANWNITQVNIDGAVVGPTSATASDFATFSGTSGKIIQDSGISLDTDTALAANSNSRIPSQAAVKAYAQPIDSDLTAIAALSTTSYGRALLAIADQAALTALLAAATETLAGTAELATQTETNTGTDDARIVTPLKLQTRLAAYAQPLDSDLTSIAALATTSYGRGLLTTADQAALTAALAAASESLPGIIELATQTETNTGTDDARAVTPLKFATRFTALVGDPNSDFAAYYATAKA